MAEPSKTTILVVEDEDKIGSLIEVLLKRLGYNVVRATNGGAAIALSNEYQGTIHLLLTDIMMPDIHGLELAERLLNLRPDLKVLYMSAYTGSSAVRDGVVGAGMGFLPKPFKPGDLERKVKEVLAEPPTA